MENKYLTGWYAVSKCCNYTNIWRNTTENEGIDKNEVTPFPNVVR